MIVVADTSVLLNLCRVGHGDFCQRLFHEVVIPPEVAAEFARLISSTPRFAGLTLPEGIRQQSPTCIPELVRSATGLDPGEAAALSLAVEIHADAVLVDERRGYRVAQQLGLRVFGVIGISYKPRPLESCPPCARFSMPSSAMPGSGFLNHCNRQCFVWPGKPNDWAALLKGRITDRA